MKHITIYHSLPRRYTLLNQAGICVAEGVYESVKAASKLFGMHEDESFRKVSIEKMQYDCVDDMDLEILKDLIMIQQVDDQMLEMNERNAKYWESIKNETNS
jgi:hypothetical protein